MTRHGKRFWAVLSASLVITGAGYAQNFDSTSSAAQEEMFLNDAAVDSGSGKAELAELDSSKPAAAAPAAAVTAAPAATDLTPEVPAVEESAAPAAVAEAPVAAAPYENAEALFENEFAAGKQTKAEAAALATTPPVQAAAVPVAASAPPAAVPVVAPAQPASAPVAAAPVPVKAEPAGIVTTLNEREMLRRRAFEMHAQEKMVEADGAFKARHYMDAGRRYKEALAAFDQSGVRENVRTQYLQAKQGMAESYYQQALFLMNEGDYDLAKQMATEASYNGHPRSARLVADIEARKAKPAAAVKAAEHRWEQEDFKDKDQTISDNLKKGREFYLVGEYDKAQKSFEAVLAKDPQNVSAIRWREKVAQRKYDRASQELSSTRRDMMHQVREAWNPRNYNLDELKDQSQTSVGNAKNDVDRIRRDQINRKMSAIIIPEVDFRSANIHDVISFLQESSVEFDQTAKEGEKRGINIILNLGSSSSAAAASAPATTELFPAAGETAAPPVDAANAALITFKARDISLYDALKIVTEVSQTKFRVEGNVVMVMPFDAPIGKFENRSYDVLPTLSTKVDQIRQDLSKGKAENAGILGGGGAEPDAAAGDGGNWKSFFQEMGVQWPTGSSIRYIPSIGKLMVANTSENLEIFEKRLEDLNVVPSQIEIEARFVEVKQTDLSSLGFEWGLTDPWEIAQNKSDPSQKIVMGSGAFTAGNRNLYVNQSADGLSSAALTATAAGVSRNTLNPLPLADSVMTVASVLTNPELAFVLHMLQQKGNSDLLSAPKVTTQSGVDATIKVVTEYLYPVNYTVEFPAAAAGTVTGSSTPSATVAAIQPTEFEKREVGIILQVKPEVSAEGGQLINLTMSPEVVTDPTWKDYGFDYDSGNRNLLHAPMLMPFFHSRSITTTISIYNGATVVMGGMITEARTETDDKVPFFGDIPVLGHLFRSKSDSSEKRNLLIFVTARLVDPYGRPIGRQQAMANTISGAQ